MVSKIKILVVENEMVIADTICMTLRKLGYHVLPPAHGYAYALNLLDKEIPDLALLDINLGGPKDGIDLAIEIREKLDIPVIFLTANSDTHTVSRAREVRPDAYLVKPFSREDLYTAIEIALGNHEAKSAARPTHIIVKDGYEHCKVLLQDILYISSEQNYAMLHLKSGKKLMARSTLQEMLDKLGDERFYRVNRGAIVNILHIHKIDTEQAWIGDEPFSISKPVREDLLLHWNQNV